MKNDKKRFHCWIKYDQENKLYLAGCYEITTLFSQGETLMEAKDAIKNAIKLFFKHAQNEVKKSIVSEMNKMDHYNPLVEIE